jgi:hypothetical protein
MMPVELHAFVLGDGDSIRQRVESLLLAGDLVALRSFSAAITSAIGQLALEASATMAADVIVAGGDDLLLRIPAESFNQVALAGMAVLFKEQTGCGISFGVASSLEGAYLNLRRAKARGGAVIVGTVEL